MIGWLVYFSLFAIYIGNDLTVSANHEYCLTLQNESQELRMEQNETSAETENGYQGTKPSAMTLLGLLMFCITLSTMILDLLTYNKLKRMIIPETESTLNNIIENCMKIPIRATFISTIQNLSLSVIMLSFLIFTPSLSVLRYD